MKVFDIYILHAFVESERLYKEEEVPFPKAKTEEQLQLKKLVEESGASGFGWIATGTARELLRAS